MRNTNPRISAEIRAEAIEWLISFSEGDVDASARKRFNDWLRASPEHVGTYLRVSAFWQDADRIAPQDQRDIDELVRQASAESNVHALTMSGVSVETKDPVTTEGRVTPMALAVAAVLIAAVGAAVVWQTAFRTPTYTTQLGELRTITLNDGSTVTLNADSRMSVRFTGTERFIDLSDGQALFKVTKDSARPFIVQSSDTRITAIGTQFDVNRKTNGTVVTVIEGRVSVSAPSPKLCQDTRVGGPTSPDLCAEGARDLQDRAQAASVRPDGDANGERAVFLSAGEQAIVTPARTSKLQAPNPSNTTAWTSGTLVFDSEPLREVARAFNRQNTKRLIVTDPNLQQLEISGVFPATGASAIAEFLRERFAVRIIETDTEIRIEPPSGTNQG